MIVHNSILLTLLQVHLLLFISTCKASKYTAKVDYGFGPLFINVDTEGDKLTRCEMLDISFGGGFGPYRLVTVNAADKSSPVPLKTNRTAVWEVAVSEDSHVAFNITSRAGATFQTPLFKVKAAPKGVTCANNKDYTKTPKDEALEEEEASSSGVSIVFQSEGQFKRMVFISLVGGAVLIPALMSIA